MSEQELAQHDNPEDAEVSGALPQGHQPEVGTPAAPQSGTPDASTPSVPPQGDGQDPIELQVRLAAVVDNANSQYQVEWQRIGNMQQSAGALVTALAILYSVIVAILLLPANSPFHADPTYLNQIILPMVYFGSVFLFLTTLFFFQVVWPKQVPGMQNPLALHKDIADLELWQAFSQIAARLDVAIVATHQLVEKKHKAYTRALISCATSFTAVGIALLLILVRIGMLQTTLHVYLTLLVVAAIAVIVKLFLVKGAH